MFKRLLLICAALALGGCSGCSSEHVSGKTVAQEQTKRDGPPVSVTAPISVEAYVPLDCGASQLLLVDKSGENLYLYNKPFSASLFLSTKGCSEEPDLTCSVHITKGHPLQGQLAAALTEYASTQADEKMLQRIRAQADFTELTEPEQVLFGTLLFAESLRGIE